MKAVVLLTVMLSGCASNYSPEGFGVGFSDTRLSPNVFRVSFRGNGFTTPERAEELALLRGAELTLKNGFSHFALADSQSRESRGAFALPTQSYTTANVNAYGNMAYGTSTTTTSGAQVLMISKPTVTHTILCFNGQKEAPGPVFDAKFVCESLGSKYGVVCGGN